VLLLLAQVCLLEFRLFRLELFAQGLFTSVIIELHALIVFFVRPDHLTNDVFSIFLVLAWISCIVLALIKCLCGLSDAQWA
jgi:hypothetical protein